MKKWLIALAVVVAAYFVASPYITMYQMRWAAEQRDGQALSEHIDFPSVREDLKDQLNIAVARRAGAEMEDNPFAVIGGALAGVIVGKVVDLFVTPAGVIELMKGEIPKGGLEKKGSSDKSAKRPFGKARYGYQAWDKFVVRVPDKDGDEVVFVLRRSAMGWKLANISLPVEDPSG